MTTTATKERPIIFSGEMVRAILDGRKTQTRRVVKPQPNGLIDWHDASQTWQDWWDVERGYGQADQDARTITCPHGVPGDRLWVRETWRVGAWNDDPGRIAVDYRADNHARREWLDVPDVQQFNTLLGNTYRELAAKGVRIDSDSAYRWKAGESPCKWRSPYYMFRWASRIMLKITDVRVQRVREIGDADVRAEGVDPASIEKWKQWLHSNDIHGKAFGELWDSLNAKRGHSWESNPWVWAITFRKLSDEEAAA